MIWLSVGSFPIPHNAVCGRNNIFLRNNRPCMARTKQQSQTSSHSGLSCAKESSQKMNRTVLHAQGLREGWLSSPHLTISRPCLPPVDGVIRQTRRIHGASPFGLGAQELLRFCPGICRTDEDRGSHRTPSHFHAGTER